MTPAPQPLQKGSPEYAVMEIIERIRRQPELQQSWKSMANAEKNYIVGDFFNIVNDCASHSASSDLTKLWMMIEENNSMSVKSEKIQKWIDDIIGEVHP